MDYDAPDILIVSPPPLCETDDAVLGPMFAGRFDEAHMLASVYADIADETGCGFFDAGSVAKTTPVDGVHLDGENTRAIARGVEPIVRMMLGL
jgi:lysophospholipase L1-like esterase